MGEIQSLGLGVGCVYAHLHRTHGLWLLQCVRVRVCRGVITKEKFLVNRQTIKSKREMSQNKRHHRSPPGRALYVLPSSFFRNRGRADGDPPCLQDLSFSTPSVSGSQATWTQGRCRSSVQIPRHAEEFGGATWWTKHAAGAPWAGWADSRAPGGAVEGRHRGRRGGAVFSHQLEDCSRHAQALRRFCVREFCRRRDPCEGVGLRAGSGQE